MSAEKLKIFIQELNFKKNQGGGIISDPAIYIKVVYGKEVFKTKTTYGKGKNPRFDEEFDLGEGKADDKIIVSAWDQGTFSDTFIGECTIFIDQLKIGKGVKNGYTLLKDITRIGNLFIESIFIDKIREEKEEVEEEKKPEANKETIKPTKPPVIPQVHNP